MPLVAIDDVRQWYLQSQDFAEFAHSIGRRHPDDEYLEQAFHLPFHLQFVVEQLADEGRETIATKETTQAGSMCHGVAEDALNSIPFYSLCRGLFLPLSGLTADRCARVFGLKVPEPPDANGKEALLAQFLAKEVGLTLVEKLGCVLGDVFLGRKSTFKRDSLLRLLMSIQMVRRRDLLDRLTHVGDVAVLFAESRPSLKSDTPLTAAEVLRTLRFLPTVGLTVRFKLLRSLLSRCGKLEAFFLARLMLRKAGFGLEYQGSLLTRTVAQKFRVSEDLVAHATALTDLFQVAHVLSEEGEAGLRRIQLQPLSPIKPTLAGGTTDDIEKYPVWVERKYDGIRLMLHKSTDSRGSVLCGAYTRNRGDWLELVPGLDQTLKRIPAHNAIIDGELFGTQLSLDMGVGSAVRPASVYEVYAALQGQPVQPVNLRYAAFDLVYLNGQDLTGLPLSQRRQMLMTLFGPMSQIATPVPLTVSEGQLAHNKDDVNRLFGHFRAQGYEGIITKDLAAPYLINTRDPHWKKRKPEITLDLVLTGATLAVTTKERAGAFGSYVISARTKAGGWQVVGDVAGVDRYRDQEIQNEIVRSGLMTGARMERPSSSGVRPGIEIRPSIVVTVKFEGIARDQTTGELSLRDPKIAIIRSDKPASEADTIDELQKIFLRQRVG